MGLIMALMVAYRGYQVDLLSQLIIQVNSTETDFEPPLK